MRSCTFFGRTMNYLGEYRVDWKSSLVGIILFWGLGMIPLIGWLACFFIFLTTLGSLVSLRLQVKE